MLKVKGIFILTVLILALAVSGCSSEKDNKSEGSPSASPAAAEKTSLDKLKEKGEFIIATTGTYPPYAFHEESSDRPLTGFDIELLTEVWNRVDGVKVTFKEAEWDGMLAGLDAGRFDSIHQIGVTEERKAKYDFADPYLISYPTLIVLDETKDINSFEDLKGKKVYGNNTSIYGKLAESYGAVLVPEGESLELLKTKRVDAIIFNNLYFLELKKSRPDLKLRAADEADTQEIVALPLVKGGDGTVEAAFNEALKGVKEDGTYEKLSVKWFGENVLK
ncbi:transporter substrate-binding domain-containing protein [Paenibacillus radicis (ex Gao et al. 2016)]|uniref:Amino acid ABC transporter substrate-binding protein n=1 Tax=Paenibacillus radicis (ex Gao et al. 2016) TaxID=1737354 RepID=A0A917LVB2_9BACL|nr:transporter substrate-binding domain-containing protein [Paenibacillus radicis (ex Gao et al. 2016)]GGG60445.1 amino acid ABC transporter substrate-binding protein [Paenibacillus radicis (ex Gao et al. 2016)]